MAIASAIYMLIINISCFLSCGDRTQLRNPIKAVSVGDYCDGASVCNREMRTTELLLPEIQKNVVY